MRLRVVIIVQVVLLTGAVLLLGSSRNMKPDMKLGFLDLDRAIMEYKKTKAITTAIHKTKIQNAEIFRQKRNALRIAYQNLSAIDKMSLEWYRKNKDLKLAEIELKADIRAQTIEINARLREHVQMVYKEIVQVAESIARKRELAAVFKITDPDWVIEAKDSIQSMIAVRNTIWSNRAADITDDVIKLLNK